MERYVRNNEIRSMKSKKYSRRRQNFKQTVKGTLQNLNKTLDKNDNCNPKNPILPENLLSIINWFRGRQPKNSEKIKNSEKKNKIPGVRTLFRIHHRPSNYEQSTGDVKGDFCEKFAHFQPDSLTRFSNVVHTKLNNSEKTIKVSTNKVIICWICSWDIGIIVTPVCIWLNN